MTPAAYRHGGRGIEIRYRTASTAIGRVLVAATARGVCSVILGQSDVALESALRHEYPAADVGPASAGDRTVGPWLDSIVRYLDGAERGLEVPLDVQGTPFQRGVWAALQEIPYGETRSYSQVAQAIGAPAAARAVAQACATNPAAIVIPCHRVIRNSGELGGYRWGVERKRRILAHEQAIVARAVSS
jgi:AraC family transcriptional regulator of adaptative response/methylated-DNA-[protein]-cysteine methyltransferase